MLGSCREHLGGSRGISTSLTEEEVCTPLTSFKKINPADPRQADDKFSDCVIALYVQTTGGWSLAHIYIYVILFLVASHFRARATTRSVDSVNFVYECHTPSYPPCHLGRRMNAGFTALPPLSHKSDVTTVFQR